jgi:hypothetical protein
MTTADVSQGDDDDDDIDDNATSSDSEEFGNYTKSRRRLPQQGIDFTALIDLC